MTTQQESARTKAEAEGLFGGYSPQEERPLVAYALLIALFNAGFAGAIGAARASGRKVPERIGLADLLLLGTATQKLSRLLAKDIVTSALRAPFTEFGDYSGQGEVNESARGHGLQKAIGELATCPFCVGQWVSAGFVSGFVASPRLTRLVASVFATLSIADFLQLAYGRARPE
jgi:hypothetical protein